MENFENIKVGQAVTNAWELIRFIKPRYTVTMVAEIEATGMERLRQAAKQAGAVAPSFTALVMKAAAQTLKANPSANRAILGPPFYRRLYQFGNVDISVAVEKDLPGLPGFPYAPTVHDTLTKSGAQITEELRKFAAANESNDPRFRLFMRILKYLPFPFSLWLVRLPEWSPKLWVKHRGCAAWVNSPSRAGADLVLTTWPWPVTFSFGVVRERPRVVNGEVLAILTMPVILSFDRRIMGGGPASRIFAQFKSILENAEKELV